MRRLLKIVFFFILLLWLITSAPVAIGILQAPVTLAQAGVAAIELHNLQHFVLVHRQLDGAFMPEETFQRLVKTNFHSKVKNPGRDCWGIEYGYVILADGFAVASAGPDRSFYTDDDLVLIYKEEKT